MLAALPVLLGFFEAPLTAALAAGYTWRDKAPAWGLILGFALLWVLGALFTYYLHRSFNRSAGT